jgi:hypothetical protein
MSLVARMKEIIATTGDGYHNALLHLGEEVECLKADLDLMHHKSRVRESADSQAAAAAPAAVAQPAPVAADVQTPPPPSNAPAQPTS